ncbi:MAG TPA: TonB-dependent receptor [Longimicrobiales bacterium]|nr:TonB-dependent receptor [Longimicrobiales bacterium]
MLLLFLTLLAGEGGVLQGTVRAEGSLEPIASATVAVEGLGRAVQTDARGYFVLPDVPAGRWQVSASALGYRTTGLGVVSAGQGTIRLDFELALQPVQLPALQVRRGRAEAVADAEAGPAAISLSGPALKQLPALAEPDVLRALQSLPSVAAASDFSSALYIRGGSPDQSLLTLDGLPLFNPYHLGGIFSAIAPDAVSSVDLRAGALPARAGDRLSGAVAIRTRDGGRDHTRAQGSVGLLSAHATVDGPLPGGRGSWIAGGRRTYLDALTHATKAVGLNRTSLPYGFYDGYLKATRDVGALGSLTLSTYLDREGIQIPKSEQATYGNEMDMGWGSAAASLAYRQPLSARWLLEARAGYSGFGGRFDARHHGYSGLSCGADGCQPLPGSVRDTNSIVHARTSVGDVLAGADLTWFAGAHTVRGGLQADAYRFRHDVDPVEDGIRDLVPPLASLERLTTLAGYVEDEWRPLDRLELRGGLRVLGAGRLGAAWMPRFGARLRLAPTLSLTAGGGLYAQALRTLRDEESVFASLFAYDLLSTPPVAVGLARGRDAVLGAEWATSHMNLRLETYLRRTSDLALPPIPSDPTAAPIIVVDGVAAGSGSARGVELMAHHESGRADLTLAYALAFADRGPGEDRFPARWERRHTLDATAGLRWGERGRLSLRAVLGSGQPYTPISGVAQQYRYDPVTGRWELATGQVLLGEHNSGRLPGYFRLDFGARREYPKHWFGRSASLTPYVQVLNVLATKNALAAEAEPRYPRLKYWPQLPFLPTLGLEWRF